MIRYLIIFTLALQGILVSACLAEDSAAEEQQYVQATVAEAFIELHTGPGRGYPIFYVAERGEKVSILKQRTDWFKVKNHRGKTGWVHIDQIAKTLDNNGELLSINYPQLDDFAKRVWEGGVMTGDFGGTDVITVYGAYHFTQNLSLELAISENFGDFSDGEAASLNLVHQPFPQWRYSPFVTLGGGTRKTDPKSSLVQTKDRTDDFLNVGGGVRIYLTRQFLLRLQYKHYTVLTSRDDDEEVEEWKIGLSTFF